MDYNWKRLIMTTTRQRAENIYRKMNSFSNPSHMNDIEREWIVSKIEEGINEYRKDQHGKLKWEHISIETKFAFIGFTIVNILLIVLR